MGRKVFDCKKHTIIKHHANYRRIKGGRYYKSIAKFKSEKLRRQKILKLQNQGHTITQIASKLKVSRRTIHRDLQKLRPFIQAELNRLSWDNTASLLSLSNKDLAETVKRYREVIRKARQRAQVKALTVRIKVDAAFADRLDRAVSFLPSLPVDLGDGGKITFELHAQGRVLEASHLYLGITPQNQLIIETNITVDPLENPTFSGLEVTDTANPKPKNDQANLRQLAQIQHRMFNFQNPWRIKEFQNLNPQQQDQLLEQYSELCGQQKSLRKAKTLTVTLNVDQAVNALYPASFRPHLPVALEDYSKIILKLQASTKTQHLITLQATDIEHGLVNIEKSEPHSNPKVNSLMGLKIIDKTDTAGQPDGGLL